MTYLVLAGLLVLFVVALRSFLRFRREQAAQMEALRQAAESRGWRFESQPARDVALRITGMTDGIPWTLRQDDAHGESDVPAVVWSTTAVDTQPIRLYAGDAGSVRAMRDVMGEMVLRLTEQAFARKGLSAGMLRDFFAQAEDYEFASPQLNARYAVLAESRALARQLLTPDVERALRDWPGATPGLQVGNRKVSIHWPASNLDEDALRRLVDLGLRLARRLG